MQQEKLKEAWEKTESYPFTATLKKENQENLTSVIRESQGEIWENAFDQNQTREKVLICADERVMPMPGEFKVGTAGQLILDSKEFRDNFINSFKGKIKAVRSHSGCGAAGIAYSKLNEEEKQKFIVLVNELSSQGVPIDEINQSDLYGAYHSYDLAKKLDANFEHTPFTGMRGNEEFHDARAIFWSADPTFDPSSLVDKFLPPHFLSNGLAFGVNEDYCKEELKTLAGIALGDHGFGSLFSSENPFYVISIGKNEEEARKLNEAAKEVMKDFGSRVVFRYFVR